MIAVIQRTYHPAEVKVAGKIIGKIAKGLVILLGVNKGDEEKDAQILAEKIINLRIFNDENEKMNHSLKDIQGEAMIISQFTLSETANGVVVRDLTMQKNHNGPKNYTNIFKHYS